MALKWAKCYPNAVQMATFLQKHHKNCSIAWSFAPRPARMIRLSCASLLSTQPNEVFFTRKNCSLQARKQDFAGGLNPKLKSIQKMIYSSKPVQLHVLQTRVWGWSPQPPEAMGAWGFLWFFEKKAILGPFASFLNHLKKLNCKNRR